MVTGEMEGNSNGSALQNLFFTQETKMNVSLVGRSEKLLNLSVYSFHKTTSHVSHIITNNTNCLQNNIKNRKVNHDIFKNIFYKKE
jgi:hypothetical protein